MMPARPRICAPVGKSGPLTCSIRSSTVACRESGFDQVDRGVDDLAEVVGRDVRGHADRDALAAVDQQVREPGRQRRGLFGGAVVVRDHVDGVFVDVGEQLHRERVQAALGVARGGRTEVGLP